MAVAGLLSALLQGAAAAKITLPHSAMLWRVAETALSEKTAAEHSAAIARFVAAIDDGRIDDALAMMGPNLVPDAAARAAWTRQFAAIISLRLVEVRPASAGANGPCFDYRVALEAAVSPEAAKAPIPNYGWDDHPNLRWIALCPGSNRSWLISSFGTGP